MWFAFSRSLKVYDRNVIQPASQVSLNTTGLHCYHWHYRIPHFPDILYEHLIRQVDKRSGGCSKHPEYPTVCHSQGKHNIIRLNVQCYECCVWLQAEEKSQEVWWATCIVNPTPNDLLSFAPSLRWDRNDMVTSTPHSYKCSSILKFHPCIFVICGQTACMCGGVII